MPPSLAHDFKTNTAYLADPQAYEVSTLLDEWPEAENIFVRRTAANLQPGVSLRMSSIHALMELFGSLISARQETAFTFALDLGCFGTDEAITAHLLCTEEGISPPLTADNAGFFAYALNWFAGQQPAVTVTVTTNALFWVHLTGYDHA